MLVVVGVALRSIRPSRLVQTLRGVRRCSRSLFKQADLQGVRAAIAQVFSVLLVRGQGGRQKRVEWFQIEIVAMSTGDNGYQKVLCVSNVLYTLEILNIRSW